MPQLTREQLANIMAGMRRMSPEAMGGVPVNRPFPPELDWTRQAPAGTPPPPALDPAEAARQLQGLRMSPEATMGAIPVNQPLQQMAGDLSTDMATYGATPVAGMGGGIPLSGTMGKALINQQQAKLLKKAMRG